MGILDKILLVMLLLMLPLGLLVAQQLTKPETDTQTSATASEYEQATVEDLQKMLESIQAQPQNQASQPQPEPFQISSVTYASDSGRLQVSGSAPEANMAVTVSATVLPPAALLPQELAPTASGSASKQESVLGQAVTVRSVKPQPGGSFQFEFAPELKEGLVQLTLQQGNAIRVVQFDLASSKQVL